MLRNLKIGTRLGLAFGTCVLLLLAMAVISEVSLARVEATITEINTDHFVKVDRSTEIKDELNDQSRRVRNLLLVDKPEQIAAELKQLGESRERVRGLYDKLGPSIQTPDGKALYADVQARRGEYVETLDAYLKLAASGDAAAARQMLTEQLRARHSQYLQSLDKFADRQSERMAVAGKEAEGVAHFAAVTMVVVALAGVAIAILAGWLVTGSITGPIGRAVAVADNVARGDLSGTIVVDRNDETGALLKSLKTMNESLARMVGEVRQSSDSIATGSSQIATGNADLSQRTELQASNLQQTAASMEELTSTVKNNADSAQQANQLAGAASAAAAQGGQVVSQVITTMQDITTSSKKISDIIGVIDGIAFQTNILALNAAVEAARAGEQGRGFAVVASEVRSLAQRSANAAKEIKALIGDSVDKVETGSRLVNDAGQSMDDIVRQVQRVSDLIGEISSATIEQTSGIGQVGHAVTELDRSTQQNAALVEESAAAAESLKQQASRLAEVVGTFKLSKDEASAALARAKKEPPRLPAPKSAAPAAKPAPTRVAAAPTMRAPAPAPAPASRPTPRPAPAASTAPARRPVPSVAVTKPAAAPAAAPTKVATAKTADDGEWESF